jgi:hypothetical protein
MNDNTKPVSAADEIKSVNKSANRQFNGDQPAPGAKLPEADDAVTKANHQANVEFNKDKKGDTLGNTVGGLRGPSD